jgi:hypothetical protein
MDIRVLPPVFFTVRLQPQMKKYRCLLGKSTANHNIWYFLHISGIRLLNPANQPVESLKVLARCGFDCARLPQIKCKCHSHRRASLTCPSVCPARPPNKVQNQCRNTAHLCELWRTGPLSSGLRSGSGSHFADSLIPCLIRLPPWPIGRVFPPPNPSLTRAAMLPSNRSMQPGTAPNFGKPSTVTTIYGHGSQAARTHPRTKCFRALNDGKPPSAPYFSRSSLRKRTRPPAGQATCASSLHTASSK